MERRLQIAVAVGCVGMLFGLSSLLYAKHARDEREAERSSKSRVCGELVRELKMLREKDRVEPVETDGYNLLSGYCVADESMADWDFVKVQWQEVRAGFYREDAKRSQKALDAIIEKVEAR